MGQPPDSMPEGLSPEVSVEARLLQETFGLSPQAAPRGLTQDEALSKGLSEALLGEASPQAVPHDPSPDAALLVVSSDDTAQMICMEVTPSPSPL